MDSKELIEALKGLSPEDKKQVQEFLGAPTDAPAPDPEKPRKTNAKPKAGRVWFFRQKDRVEVYQVEAKDDKLVKHARALPDRVIALDTQGASLAYWKHRDKEYLGTSDGETWRRCRVEGLSVPEAQAKEYEAMLELPKEQRFMLPPQSEKVGFRGTKLHQVAQGNVIPWSDTLKQQGKS